MIYPHFSAEGERAFDEYRRAYSSKCRRFGEAYFGECQLLFNSKGEADRFLSAFDADPPYVPPVESALEMVHEGLHGNVTLRTYMTESVIETTCRGVTYQRRCTHDKAAVVFVEEVNAVWI